jgi:anaerobic selenocysteine-containing dehydrogenase
VLYGHDPAVLHGPSLRKLVPEPAAHLHPDDAAARGIAAGDRVVVRDGSGEATLDLVLDESLAPGTVYVPANTGVSIGAGLDVEVEGAP